MKNKKILTFKIFAAVGAVALIVCILFVTNAFVGNPISQIFANRAIKQYIGKNYSTMNLEIEKSKYNFKDAAYVGMAKSKTSIDSKFAIYYRNGKVQRDNYESYVVSKLNTWQRLTEEYSAIAKNIVSKELGYHKNTTMVDFKKEESEKQFENFELDMKFDKELFKEPEVFIRLDLEDNSMDAMAKILIDAHKAFVDNDCIFHKYGLNAQNSDRYYVMVTGVTSADIEGGQLTTLLEKAKTNSSGSGISVLIKEKNK